MEIPKQLQQEGIRFVLLGKWDEWKQRTTKEIATLSPQTIMDLERLKDEGWIAQGKAPFEKDWQNKGYKYDDKKLLEHIKKGNNFGVIGGYGRLRILDIDSQNLIPEIEKAIGKTFTVKTGSGGRHFYFFSDYDLNCVLGNEAGELRANNYQVVSAPCKHPLGKDYEIVDDCDIKEMGVVQLRKIISTYSKPRQTITEIKTDLKDTSRSGLEYRRVLALIQEGLTKEQIFEKMMAYSKWATHGQQFPQYREDTYNKALEYLKEQSFKEKETTEDKVEIIWEKEMKDYNMPEKEWLIDKLVPTKSVCILTGKRGTLKTFIALQMAYSITLGIDFLNHFPTRNGLVVYLDKENGIPVLKKRINLIRKGLNLNKDADIGFICFSQLKIDRKKDIEQIEDIIKTHKPTLLIVDTYRRGISFDENDAGAVSELFVDVLRPLVEKYDISILLIHHDRKSAGFGGDEMDEIRGSSDLANYADIILKMERKKGSLVLKQLKNRNAAEIDPIRIRAEFNETYLKLNYEGEFKTLTKDEKCVEILTIWFAETRISQFTTNQAQEIVFKEGIKPTNLKNALNIMQDSGIIIKVMKGVYKINK